MMHMRPTLTLLVALLAPGCFAQTEPPTPEPAECAWTDDTYTCDPALLTHTVEALDEVDTFCWVHTYHCGDRVDACQRQVYDCQPKGDARIGRP
jgi:hypothetical protein